MGLFRCTVKKHGHAGHKWSYWRYHGLGVHTRSCKCGAIQRTNAESGEVTIWTPDGLDSGLLDRGITRKIYEELE